ncbi:hypothetical protein J2X69_004910 [Algoriphagus sp. 4150]|uniref:hypothetical protein n=1 Tax=Algoriphagus sp. 4150 TaxID=2817756 RepID=UPI0028629488|nr:hypothetical protein [Algoriphagus sp. 4150]MDR7132537.1 hypothetical protein [Algoriphagus sp. 4150]
MSDIQIDFYAQLGKLSVNFARMELKLSSILNYLIDVDEDLIPVILTENNSLHQTIDLVKKINKIKNFESEIIKDLLERISSVKSSRNLFIHGIWGEPFESENDIKIVCEEHKIRYQEKTTEYGVDKQWKYNNFHTFTLSFLKQLTTTIEDIIRLQDYLLNKLKVES